MICVFCVVCGSPYCWLIQPDTDAQRHQRDPCFGLVAADRPRQVLRVFVVNLRSLSDASELDHADTSSCDGGEVGYRA